MLTTSSDLGKRLEDKEYRDAFVASEINMGLPFQIRCLREGRGWTQSELAERASMKQPRISAIESPGSASLNLETLRRLASAFDCALIVRFAPFSELMRWSEEFGPDTFQVRSFLEESQHLGLSVTENQPASDFVVNRPENPQGAESLSSEAGRARLGISARQPGTSLAFINRLVGGSSQELPRSPA